MTAVRGAKGAFSFRELLPAEHWFFGALAQNSAIYGQTILAASMVNFLGLFTSFFIMTVYDRVLPNQALESLFVLTFGVLIAHIFDFVLKGLRGYFIDVAGQRLDASVGSQVFDNLIAMRMDARKGGVGATANLVREFDNLRDFFSSATLVAVVDLPFILLFLAVIAMIGGPIVLAPLAAVTLAIGATILLQPIILRHTKTAMTDGQTKHGILIETLAGIETVKSAGAGQLMRRRWRDSLLKHAKTSTLGRFLSQLGVNITAFCQQTAQVAVVVIGVLLVGSKDLSMGGLIACVILTGRAMAPLAQVAGLLGRVSGAFASYKALDALFALKLEADPDRAYLVRSKLKGRIEFREVTFSYPGQSARALDCASFIVEQGERVAVLGRNGSGKSTIVRLALGVYDPSEGQILVDDTDIRQLRPSDLRANVGAVLQDVCLFSGTIRENIALGLDRVSDEAILEAARISGVHDFIGASEAGYDMRLAERGEGLSGGQKQAIALARALAPQPSILLLDEPTSALDNQAEAAMIARLRRATEGRTLLLVTHRMSMLRLVDRIIVIDQGRIVIDGPRDAIVRQMTAGRASAPPLGAPSHDAGAATAVAASGAEATPIHSRRATPKPTRAA